MRKKSRQRKAAAIVELAICLPLLVFLVFGTIEIAGSIFLKQTMTSAAHEGALSGMRQNAQESEIITRVNAILAARSVTGCTVQVVTDGPLFADLSPGDPFRVQISKTQSNSYIDLANVAVSVGTQRQ